MEESELGQVLAAVLILFVAVCLPFVYAGDFVGVAGAFAFSVLIIGVHVFSRKGVAGLLDCEVRSRIWRVRRFGVKPKQKFKNELPFGAIIPLVISAFSTLILWPVGLWFYFLGILSYEARALKYRAARRFGARSFSSLTELHNALIGAGGIFGVLVLAVVGLLLGIDWLFKIGAYYVFWNLLPLGNLDGTQIYFGNRILWFVLAAISVLFVLFGLVL